MSIGKHNYEAFMLDYLEGRLDQKQLKALQLFFEENPSLKPDFAEMEMIACTPDLSICFSGKKELKKNEVTSFASITEGNFHEYFWANSEGDLSEKEQLVLSQFLELNPSLQKDYELLAKCRLTPDASIIYPSKIELKKTPPEFFISRKAGLVWAVAASVLLLIGFFWLMNPVQINQAPVVQVKGHTEGQQQQGQTLAISAEPTRTSLAQITYKPHPAPEKLPPIESRVEILPFSETLPALSLSLMQLNTMVAGLIKTETIGSSTRNEVSQFYDDIALAQNLRYYEPSFEEMAKEGTINFGSALVRSIFKPEDAPNSIGARQIDWWELADAGINGFSRISSSSLAFSKETDQNGNVKAFALQSNNFNISREVRSRKD